MTTDAIVLLKDDHKQLRALFRQFAAAEANAKQQHEVVHQIIEALTVHTYIENECMYPRVRQLLPDLGDDILESCEEHHVADILCGELAALDAEDEHFRAKATVLIENVTHHMDEEEKDWFPKVRSGVGRKQLQELGAEMLDLKKTAPRSPAQPSVIKKAVDALVKSPRGGSSESRHDLLAPRGIGFRHVT